MRKLSDHIVEGDAANHQLTIEIGDEPGDGGADSPASPGNDDGPLRFDFHKLIDSN